MRILNKLSIGAALIGSVILSCAGAAQADDHWDHRRWDRDHDRGYHHEREHERHERVERRVVEHRYVEERPVYVERPMMVAPPVVYQQPGPPSMNLNFNIPLN